MFGKRLKKTSWVGKYFIPERELPDDDYIIEGIEICCGLSGFKCNMFATYSIHEVKTLLNYDGPIYSALEYKIAFNSLTKHYNMGTECS